MQDKNKIARDELDSFGMEGTRRVTGVDKESSSKVTNNPPDPEVSSKAKRRRFSKAYKLRTLTQWDKCTQQGQKASLLRCEGLYSQTVTNWLKQRKTGKLKSSDKPVNTTGFTKAEKHKLMRLELENEKLKRNLAHAEKIINLQKKVAELLDLPPVQEDDLK
jgi:transposase-like protein|tara:strand:- start:908 stop:1393 length:486 start_codon:yes stop_codon:yes gene_type:complete